MVGRARFAGADAPSRFAVPAVRGTLLRSTSPIVLTCVAAVALGASGERADAANECGAPVGGAVTCSGSSYPAPDGIGYANITGPLTLTLDNPNLVAQRTSGGQGGVFVSGSAANTNDIVANALRFQSVTSTALLTNGIGAVNQGAGGNAIVRMDTGTVTVGTNSGGNGLVASITNAANAGNALVTLNGGQVINTGDGTITGIGNGVNALNAGTGNATVTMMGGSVSTAGPAGLRAAITNAASAGTASITVNAGTIDMSGSPPTGTGAAVFATTNGSGLAQATVNGGVITATRGAGVGAVNTGTGNATANLTDGSVTAGTSFAVHGVYASANGSALATMSGGSISTKAIAGDGLRASSSAGAATAIMTGGSVVATGSSAAGVVANVASAASSAGVTVQFSSGSVTSTGASGIGLAARTAGSGAATIQMSGGTASATGNNGDGIFAQGGTYAISLTGGTVTGGSGTGAAIHAAAAAGGTITIGAGALVKAGASGIALSQTGGAATITTAGAVTGNINLSAANNVLNVTGGAIDGNISGGGNSALKFDLGAGSFTYGAAYAISGIRNVAMISGSAQIDGTLASGTLTVNGGRLILTGTNSYTGTALNGGVLQVSADANLGDPAGGLSFNGGTLAATASFATGRAVTLVGAGAFEVSGAGTSLTLDGTVSGPGGLTKLGDGVLVLTGANSYGGGTALNGGVLQVSADANLGDPAGGLSFNGGTLAATASFATGRAVTLAGAGAFDVAGAGTSLTLDGAISGPGGLTKLGDGTLVLTEANAYGGGTTISAGTLQLGNGGATGSIAGDVVNNGTLAFNRLDDITFAGVISGTGGVQKLGAGSLILAGANSYGGGTTISAGTLIGAATSFGTAAIANSAALVIDQPTNASFANAINGTGSFTKRGAGNLNLTGSSGLTGATTVEAGKLSVNGSLSGSAVTVLSGAALGGNGSVGATTLASGGRIAPGNSIGTITVNGAYVQNAGSVYEVEIDPTTGNSDRVQVNGTATLANGATLSVVNPGATAYVAGQRYTILTSSGLTGTYSVGEQVLTPFLSLRDTYDASNAYLTVVQTRSAASIGTTPNEVEVGTSVDSLPSDNPVQTGVTNTPTLEAARGALVELAGEIHASAKTVLIDESWLLRNAANDRLRSAFGSVGAAPMATMSYGFTADLAPATKGQMPTLRSDRFAVWGQGYGSWGRTDSDGNAAKLTRSTGGLLVGTDMAVFDNLRFGVLAGYSRSEFDVKGRLSSGESDNYHLGLYGGGQWGALGLRLGASYTWHDLSTRRGVISAGLGDSLRADYDAGTAQVFGELGYRIELGRVALEPFAGLAYVNLHTDGIDEIGGAAALSGRSDDTGVGYSTLGLRAATSFDLSGMGLTLRGGLAWRHAFGDVDPKATLAFSGSTPFTISGLPIARDAALVEAGLDLAIGKSASLGLSYNGQLAEDAQDHAFKGVLAVRF